MLPSELITYLKRTKFSTEIQHRKSIISLIWLKFYQNIEFQIKCYFSFYVTRCVSFVTHCVINFYGASKNLKNTIESIL